MESGVVTIENMIAEKINEYAELFVSVFNSEPWNDSWTMETACDRIESMMNTTTFIGKACYADGRLMGIIWGQKEPFYDGIHFQIQEFCVRCDEQRKGYGKALLSALNEELDLIEVKNVYLITSRGELTEGYYQKRGFVTSDCMILMTKGR